MEYTTLGATGLRVSKICLGMMSFADPAREPSPEMSWVLGPDRSVPVVRRAVEAGITFFDTADVYSLGSSEELTGRLLREFFPRREDYVLGTKVFFPMGTGTNDGGLSRKHIHAAIDASLRRLGTDYVDLYQIHRWDDETPIEETMAALHDVIRAGKTRYLGASSMWAWQFAKAQHTAERHGWTKFVSMQNHYNLLYREEEREMIPLCLDQGVGLIPWSPLARGSLARAGGDADTARARTDTRIDRLYGSPTDRLLLGRVAKVAGERDVPPARVALAWLLHRPGVTAPIVGATREGHVDDAVAAVGMSLSEAELTFLNEAYRPRPVMQVGIDRVEQWSG